MIEVRCTTCPKTIQLADSWAGKQGRWPDCGTVLTVPMQGPAVPAAPAAPAPPCGPPPAPDPVAPAGPGWWERRSHTQLAAMMAAAVVIASLITGAVTASVVGDNAAQQQTPLEVFEANRAADAAAKSLVSNAMSALESIYADVRTFDPNVMTPVMLNELEPWITFVPSPDHTAATAATALTANVSVNYFGTPTTYAVGTVSASATVYGVIVDKGGAGRVEYYVNGEAQDW